MLVQGKGMDFEVEEGDEGATGASKPKNYRVAAVMEAQDITSDQFEGLMMKKKQGKTTTEENFQVDKHYWQRHLATKELDEGVLKEHMFGDGLLWSFLSLIDMNNYKKQDNLKSARHVEKVELVQKLLEGLGFSSPLDDQAMDLKDFMDNFANNVCEEASFQNRKRINELWELRKQTSISGELNKRQVLTWVNSLLKPFSIRVKPDGGAVSLEVLNDVLGIVQRHNNHGNFYQDGKNLLRQENKEGDPFIDEATGETLIEKQEKKREQRMMDYDTSRLDVGLRDD